MSFGPHYLSFFPIQLSMIALAVGTGVGINTVMAAKLGEGKKNDADALMVRKKE